tara:strand:- start:7139 stop:7300 length:162 start_codon:yes stop_codon:yes gene_type:complete
VLFAAYLDENFVDVEGIALASVLSLQSTSINGSELDAPQPDGFTADSYAPLGE